MAKKEQPPRDIIAENRKARYNYEILEEFEVGIVLQGSEVKSLRKGKASIAEAHAAEMEGEMWLFNVNIPEYKQAGPMNHMPKRPRKLLMKKLEIKRMIGKIKEKGLTLVPLSIYFNKRGLVKILLGIGKGKKQHDKRETIKQRDWDRKKGNILKENR
ncbi:MAG: SsrA-binding protein [Alphaproteobacteria bacterium CG11_big_fil_rev_8_21_14_0_20_44_7]|nr:MAG: SsrA-binding protein [Alphaproteobacteria bacterium CG11_big_fil_rev_8_21_14_0_20_44_7]